jgi:restriction system protein
VAEPRKAAEIRQLFRDLAARFTLRAVDYALTVSPPALVDTVLVNGHVRAKDPATGKPVHPCLVSVKVSREVFEEIDLDEPALDPVACLKYLSAMLSPHPYDLEAVRPVLAFDLSRFKFVDELDVLSQLDHRQDLLQLTPTEFEHLVRQLFEAMGLKAWVTQASRDDGVDAFAFNPDPVLGGQCVIQAKRYSKVIPIEAVRALEGTIQDKRAAKGILVATSWFSSGDREFADRMGRIELIDGSNLKALLAEYLGRDVVIGLDRLPPGWLRSDIA